MMTGLRKLHLASFLSSLLLFGAMSVLAGFPILDTQWAIAGDEVYRLLGQMDAEQKDAYRLMLGIDFGYALVYPLFLVLTLHLLAVERLESRRLFAAAAAVPVVAGLFDLAENASILAIMGALPEMIPRADSLGLLTSLKWILVAASLALVLGLWAWTGIRRARAKAQAA